MKYLSSKLLFLIILLTTGCASSKMSNELVTIIKPKKRPSAPLKEKPNHLSQIFRDLTQGNTLNYARDIEGRLTINEQDALIKQLESCWDYKSFDEQQHMNMGAELRLFVNPDRTVREVSIRDVSRYNNDDIYHSTVDSAVRAINNPECKILSLPEDKYDHWKLIDVIFDPSEMF